MMYFIPPFYYYSAEHNLLYNRAMKQIQQMHMHSPQLLRELNRDEQNILTNKITQYNNER